ncbi:uncharacterized protein LOC142355154 [Convolutriloba macropyga]|uniref:uncharacterized protein LOC142355154 n=1 Tax=Convolutriloba macropyga TaxID=536237 RepID=UPI003F525E1F
MIQISGSLSRGHLLLSCTRHCAVPVQRGVRQPTRSPVGRGLAVIRYATPAGNSGAEEVGYDTTAQQPAPPQVPIHQVPQQAQYYGAVPQYPAPPPTYQPQKSGWPPVVWVGIGVVLAFVLAKVLELVRGGPQAMQEKATEMMMQQMMKQMGAAGGAGGMPGMGGMPGAGMPGAGMPGMGMPPGGFSTPPPPPAAPPTPPPAAATTAEPTAPSAATVDVQPEPVTKTEPAAPAEAKESTTKESSKSAKAFFTDFEEQSDAQTASSGTDATSSAASGASAGTGGWTPGGAAAGAAAGAGAGSSSTVDMLEQMMRDPEMQKTLYPYLPEPMRNPETMEWMLSQPEYRQQMEQMMSQMQGGGMPGGMPGGAMPDLNSPEVKEQFDQLGMSPQEVVSKILADPELAQAFQNPKVQSAIMELSSNPMAISKYQNDPEVMGLMTKLSTVFPQAGMPPPPAQ